MSNVNYKKASGTGDRDAFNGEGASGWCGQMILFCVLIFMISMLCILYLIFVVCDMACHGKGWCGYINDPILCFVFVCFDFYADKGWCGG